MSPSHRICNPPETEADRRELEKFKEFVRLMGNDRSWESQRRAYIEVYGETVFGADPSRRADKGGG